MAMGLGVLRLNPADFWAMTPKEIAAASRVLAPAAMGPPSRRDLDDLMTRFPDAMETVNG